jgi:hypothetical protein
MLAAFGAISPAETALCCGEATDPLVPESDTATGAILPAIGPRGMGAASVVVGGALTVTGGTLMGDRGTVTPVTGGTLAVTGGLLTVTGATTPGAGSSVTVAEGT